MSFRISKNIFFTGFMATGKSRIGELTAISLGRSFFDTDSLVEKKMGKSVSRIFAEDGEQYFRNLEVEVLNEISTRDQPMVASLGGGTLLNPEAVKLVRRHGVLIGLWASPDVILERVNRKKNSRPLLANLENAEKLEKIHNMLAERKPIYDLADFKFESAENMPHHQLTRKIIHTLQVEEMEPLIVDLAERSYPIYIEENLSGYADVILERVRCGGECMVVTDHNLKSNQKQMLEQIRACTGHSRIFFFKPGEEEKNFKSLNKLFSFMLRHAYSRKTTLISFSGGVIGDMVGFAAAIYMRGIDFIQIPTTLLSMVDSSVGGKTGVNHPLGKNMLGAFHQPKAVIINLKALESLPETEFLAGLAEVIKYALIWDKEFFDFLDTRCQEILSRDKDIMKSVIRRCCAIKAEVISRDERETSYGGRAILNYGHTFGHALEALSGFTGITHGLAVALGMRVAGRLAVALEMLSPEEEAEQNRLLDKFGLPRFFHHPFELEDAWAAMALDKKVERGERNYILPVALGKAKQVKGLEKAKVLAALSSIAPHREGERA